MSMLVSNILSRQYVYKKTEISPELLQLLHDYMLDEGAMLVNSMKMKSMLYLTNSSATCSVYSGIRVCSQL